MRQRNRASKTKSFHLNLFFFFLLKIWINQTSFWLVKIYVKIRTFTINYSKKLAKERKENETLLETKLKELEVNLNTEDNIQSYNIYKKELDSIYDHIAEGIRIRSKCDWYEHGERSTKFFLNLEKKRGNQNQIRKLIIDEKEIDGDVEILKKKSENFLCNITTPSLNKDQINLCEKDLS